MRNKATYFAILWFLCAGAAYAQTSDQLSVTTYYPAPYAEYQQLRLTPQQQAPQCGSANAGALYYNRDLNQIFYCNGITWQSLTGGGAGLWTQNSNSLYPTNMSSNVAVGTNTVAATMRLDINGSLSANQLCINGDSYCKSSWGYPSCPAGKIMESVNLQTGQAVCIDAAYQEPYRALQWVRICDVRDTRGGGMYLCPTFGNCGNYIVLGYEARTTGSGGTCEVKNRAFVPRRKVNVREGQLCTNAGEIVISDYWMGHAVNNYCCSGLTGYGCVVADTGYLYQCQEKVYR